MKKELGITLVALVVTIIILLILAGITISSLRRREWVNSQSPTSKKSANRRRN